MKIIVRTNLKSPDTSLNTSIDRHLLSQLVLSIDRSVVTDTDCSSLECTMRTENRAKKIKHLFESQSETPLFAHYCVTMQ